MAAVQLRRCVRGLEYATRRGLAIVSRNVVDFLRLAHDAVATNTPHPGIVLVPSSFRGIEHEAIGGAIVEELKPYAERLDGLVLYVGHTPASPRGRGRPACYLRGERA